MKSSEREGERACEETEIDKQKIWINNNCNQSLWKGLSLPSSRFMFFVFNISMFWLRERLTSFLSCLKWERRRKNNHIHLITVDRTFYAYSYMLNATAMWLCTVNANNTANKIGKCHWLPSFFSGFFRLNYDQEAISYYPASVLSWMCACAVFSSPFSIKPYHITTFGVFFGTRAKKMYSVHLDVVLQQ